MTDLLYRELIMEHYRNPQNKGVIENADVDFGDENPLCGDSVRVTAKIEDSKIIEMKCDARGCAISQASASILTEELRGKSLEEIKKMDLDYITKLLNIQLSVARVKCAMLALMALKKGIVELEAGK